MADLHESFETVRPGWEIGGHDCQWVTYEHRRVFDQAHSGLGSEFLSYATGQGTHAHLKYSILPTRVIDELEISIWVRASRRGSQLLARVVLPRTNDPQTGQPLTAWLPGSTYEQPGQWQQLHLGKPASGLQSLVFTLRTKFGPTVDAGEAYIDLVALNAYTGSAANQMWIDDLKLRGQVLRETPDRTSPSRAQRPTMAPNRFEPSNQLAEFRGDMLYVNGRPLALRTIEHRGESLAHLKSLGFNSVLFDRAPTLEEDRQAAETGLWLMAPLPLEPGPADRYRRLIAWIWPAPLMDRDIESVRHRLTQFRQQESKPVIGIVHSGIQAYSHLLDAVIVHRPILSSTLPLSDYLVWLRQVRSKMRIDCPLWTAVNTEIPATVEQQIAALGGQEESWMFSSDSLHAITMQLIQQGIRSMVFRSRHPLHSRDPVVQRRALTLGRINRDLNLLQPWLSAGRVVSTAHSTASNMRATLLKTDQARMLIGTRYGPGIACVPSAFGKQQLAFTVDGMPATDEAFQMSHTGLTRLVTHQGAGLRVVVDNPQANSFTLLTKDARAIGYVAQHIRKDSQQKLDLLRQRVRMEIQWSEMTVERLRPWLRQNTNAKNDSMEQIRERYAYLEQLSRSQETGQAERIANEILDELRHLQRSHWETAISGLPHPAASPACLSFFSLPLHWQLVSKAWNANWNQSILPAGGFENLRHLQETGWQYTATNAPQLQPHVRINHEQIRSGRGALQLECPAPLGVPQYSNTPSIRITSPSMKVQPGQLIKLSGWVRMPRPLSGSVDGLRISDTLGGAALAVQLRKTENKWHPIVLYRLADSTGSISFHIELFGNGKVWLDDFAVEVLPP